MTQEKIATPDRELMIGDVGRLVEIESPSLDLEALAQSARELALMMEQRLGSSATLIDSVAGPHVHWVGGGTPKVLIVGHHDTVFPKERLRLGHLRLMATKRLVPEFLI